MSSETQKVTELEIAISKHLDFKLFKEQWDAECDYEEDEKDKPTLFDVATAIKLMHEDKPKLKYMDEHDCLMEYIDFVKDIEEEEPDWDEKIQLKMRWMVRKFNELKSQINNSGYCSFETLHRATPLPRVLNNLIFQYFDPYRDLCIQELEIWSFLNESPLTCDGQIKLNGDCKERIDHRVQQHLLSYKSKQSATSGTDNDSDADDVMDGSDDEW